MSEPPKGVIAAGHLCTAEAACDILRSGGNAIDAVIAAAWMACVCEPVLASPGGGGFAMVARAQTTPVLHDFFAHTPLAPVDDPEFFEVFADFGETRQAFHIGKGATATPGFVPGLFHLHARSASLPMRELIAPAVAAAHGGIEMTEYQHFLSTVVAPILTASPEASDLFAPGGEIIRPAETFRNQGLGDLFELLATDGMRAYHGDVRGTMLSAQQKHGHLRDEDFACYQVAERDPLTMSLGSLDISLNPLPSAGGTLIAHTLSHLSDFSLQSLAAALDATDRDRRDPNSDLAAVLRGAGPQSPRGTTHLSVIGANGDACAMTLSNGEGNGRIVGNYGFMLNNMLGESDVNPAGATGWPTDTRLSSIMCPTIARDSTGDLFALGSGGSNRIRSAIARVLCELAGNGSDIDAAVTSARMHIEAGHLDLEGHADPEAIVELKAMFADHRIWRTPNMFFGGCHIAAHDADGRLHGVGDRRRAGVCLVA